MNRGWPLRKRTGALPLRVIEELMHMPGLLMVITNARLELLSANDYFYEYFCCEPAALMGKALYDFLGDDRHNDMNEAHIDRVINQGHVWGYDARTTLPNGENIVIRWNQCVLPDSRDEILSVGFVPDARPSETEADAIMHVFTQDASPYLPDQPFFGVNQPISGEDSTIPVVSQQEIKQALQNHAFTLYYQPYVQARTKKVVGAEALLRLNHPEHGILPPITFIPTAEQTGQIIALGEYVLDAACKKIKHWNENGLDLFMSVNISTQQFMHETFAETLLGAVTRHDVSAGRLVLEITEDTASRDLTKVRGILQTLRGIGSRISLDDFGVGFTSLRNLEMLEIDNIKIDRFFLSSALRSKRFYAIVESMIVLAHGLGMTVTAEGVEKQTQIDFLTDKSCDYLQGYLLSRPLPEQDFERLLFDNPDFYLRYM